MFDRWSNPVAESRRMLINVLNTAATVSPVLVQYLTT